ncbi:hypothetical protein D3C76_1667150 [compost metagenome]
MLRPWLIPFPQINLAGDSGGDKGGTALFEQGKAEFRFVDDLRERLKLYAQELDDQLLLF